MNIFSTHLYLRTLADVAFKGRSSEIVERRVAGRRFRLLAVEGKPVVSYPFLDFFQPIEGANGVEPPDLGYLPHAVLDTTTVELRQPEAPGQRPSPYIDWSRFDDWAAFQTFVGTRIGNLFPDSRRKKKKAERDLGPMKFVFNDPRPEVFDTCLRWKSSQYAATGLVDLFANPTNVEMFRELKNRGAVVVSSLTAGEKLMAVHFGGLADNRHYWWVPAYDPDLGKYSPGRLMLEAILEESYALKHAEFDFLIGDEAYKFHYATHNRVVGPLGQPPLRVWLEKEARKRAKSALGRYPKLLDAAQELRKRLREVRGRLPFKV
jgi:hypothetical protein